MTRLPDPKKPTAPQAGQPLTYDTARRRAAQIAAAVDDVYEQPTAVRIEDPDIPSWEDGARIGTTPPVTNQPGSRRPAMSQWAVDLNTTILSTSVAIASTGGAGSAILWASHYANPTVIHWICGCVVALPAAVAVAALALKGLTRSAKEVVAAAPPEIHQHYSGHVYQDQRSTHVHTKNSGAIAITRNQLPELPPAH